MEAKDPVEDPLKPITKDKIKNGECGWAAKTVGDCSEYRAMAKNKEQVNYGFVCLRSLIWKGWSTVYHQKQWISIYIGNGVKASDDWYFPKEPQPVKEENLDKGEQLEPNFPAEEKKPEEEGEKADEWYHYDKYE